ncbi:MAG: hypothetical protein M3O93_07890 [Chloroflexota bacterium]|nr:hypothetical protein [Chloroflexota bacterium]
MTDETISISRVDLARSLPRILAIPILVSLVGAGAVASGLILGGSGRMPLVAGGVATILLAAIVARIPLTLRLEVEVGGIRLRWLGGGRRYRLVPGPVTRATVAGADAGRGVLRIRFGFLGWAVGPGVLRGAERVSVVRLAPTPTVILVPTEGGRLALAAASEGELLAALGAAARVQQRLDEVSGRLRAAAPAALAAARQPVEQPAEASATGRILTGIERAWLEAQLTAAREAALAAAEAERAAIAEGRISVVAPTAPMHPTVTEAERWRAPNAARRRIKATWTRPAWATPAMVAVLLAWGWAMIPLVASGVAWLVSGPAAEATGTSPRILALALSLGGPAGAVGVLATRAWWPRMTGLVAITAVGALMMVARAAVG